MKFNKWTFLLLLLPIGIVFWVLGDSFGVDRKSESSTSGESDADRSSRSRTMIGSQGSKRALISDYQRELQRSSFAEKQSLIHIDVIESYSVKFSEARSMEERKKLYRELLKYVKNHTILAKREGMALALEAVLLSGKNQAIGLPFSTGYGGVFQEYLPTLRAFALDNLLRVDRKKALQHSRIAMDEKIDQAEFAISLKNLAKVDSWNHRLDLEDELVERFEEMVSQAEWREMPQGGVL